MGDNSTIEWTEATWNPVTGCSKVSAGCDNCYAERQAMGRLKGSPGYPGLPWTPENATENVVLHEHRIAIPGRWTRPRMIFVNSMSDLFHPLVPGEFINRVWMEMFNNPRHTFQVLTKRPKRLRDWTRIAAKAKGWPEDEIWPDWMWVGTSIENREHVGRADLLRETPAAVRFISAEPLLGALVNVPPLTDKEFELALERQPLDGALPELGESMEAYTDRQKRELAGLRLDGIAWLIVGGESGPGHRPIQPDWVRALCGAAREDRTAFFFKQWGGRSAKAGGRELDGRTWSEMPTREPRS